MELCAIRGAITIAKNDRDEILKKTKKLLSAIIKENDLSLDKIISIIFTATKDITAIYPAVAARQLGMDNIPLMCCQEMQVDNSLPLCIRVILHTMRRNNDPIRHIYLGGASKLRPDLACTNAASNFSIAIDGPAGAGKSTIARIISQKLNILYLDTGAMYRAIAYKVLTLGIEPSQYEDVISLLPDIDIKVQFEDGIQKILLNSTDITNELREEPISKAASAIAIIPEVRLKLVELQREIANENSLVMDGRDIGTYVLPYANIKIFLTASVEERAIRRWNELKQKGQDLPYDDILHDIIARDENDTNREFAPLKKADDAILVDTTSKSIEVVVDEILSIINQWR